MEPERQEVEIAAWLWDDENEAHIREKHPDVSPAEVDSVLDGRWIALENAGHDRRAEVMVLGRTGSGRLLVVAANATTEQAVWRPVTAHPMRSKWQRDRYATETEGEEGGHD